jgi:hypothetical protein
MIEKHEVSVLMKSVGQVVKDYVSRATDPIKSALGDVERQVGALKSEPKPKDGRDADPEMVRAAVHGELAAFADAFAKGLQTLP